MQFGAFFHEKDDCCVKPIVEAKPSNIIFGEYLMSLFLGSKHLISSALLRMGSLASLDIG